MDDQVGATFTTRCSSGGPERRVLRPTSYANAASWTTRWCHRSANLATLSRSTDQDMPRPLVTTVAPRHISTGSECCSGPSLRNLVSLNMAIHRFCRGPTRPLGTLPHVENQFSLLGDAENGPPCIKGIRALVPPTGNKRILPASFSFGFYRGPNQLLSTLLNLVPAHRPGSQCRAGHGSTSPLRKGFRSVHGSWWHHLTGER